VRQAISGGTHLLQTLADYTSPHLPKTITDAAGQDTTITYNSAGQPLTVTNAIRSAIATRGFREGGLCESGTLLPAHNYAPHTPLEARSDRLEEWPMHQSTHDGVANSTAPRVRYGPRCRPTDCQGGTLATPVATRSR
jgi:YD repeat-containing protein